MMRHQRNVAMIPMDGRTEVMETHKGWVQVII